MRDKIWMSVRSKLPEGSLLPWWAITMRAILFPLDFFFWRMSQTRGYQCESDTWRIEGVTYSAVAMRWLAKAQGETYRVTRTGETVTLERVQPLQDGYWTPWHLAAEAVSAAVAAEREAIDRMLDHRSHQIDGLSDACSFAAEVLRDMRKQIRAMGPK